MKVEIITHPTGIELPILLDSDGLPIPSPNEFILSRRTLSTNTLIRNLRELTIFYNWIQRENIDLPMRLESKGQFFSEAEIKGSLVEALRLKQQSSRNSSTVVSPISFNQRISTVRHYLIWSFDLVSHSIVSSYQKLEKVLEHKKRVIRWLDSSFINTPPDINGIKKSLNTEEENFLIDILNPLKVVSGKQNLSVLYRNYISVLIMLKLGLRPGELLSLKVEDVVIGAISSINVVRRPPDPNDIRKPRPRIKRNGRILSIDDPELLSSLDEYILTYRDELEISSREDTEYLIISDEGNPLSQATLGQLFRNIRNKFPDKLPNYLSPKTLRHTFSIEMEKTLRMSGMKEDHRSQALAYLRGDSSLKSQDVYIDQEITEQAQLALKSYHSKILKE